MDKPTTSQGPPILEIPGDVGRTFALRDFSAMADVRRWVRGLLPVDCAVRNECVLIASELTTNLVEHGGGGRAVLTIGHGSGPLRGVLVHHDAPEEMPKMQEAALMEIARLLGLGSGEMPDVESLLEDGRGLALVASVCRGDLAWVRETAGLVIRWELSGCTCLGGGLSC
jgi:hypothetical protein